LTCDIPAKDIALMYKPTSRPGRQALRE
jgi:hypothetical protein